MALEADERELREIEEANRLEQVAETIEARKEYLRNSEAQDLEQKRVSKILFIALITLGPLVYLLLNPEANFLSRMLHNVLVSIVEAVRNTQ
jgi:uncharacterized membrane protein